MFTEMLHRLSPALLTAALVLPFAPGEARAQFRGRPPQQNTQQPGNGPQPFAAVRPQFNGLSQQSAAFVPSLRQQNTGQTGCQQTGASQITRQPTSDSSSGATNSNTALASLQQLQTALQNSLQQTTALLTALQQNGSSSQSALVTALQQEQTALQAALQQTNDLLTALQQNGQLTTSQAQTLRAALRSRR
jgi:hypothetical protein